jgi:phospholipid/cholesterol/gamma-HCH transport system substrate-binding protein
MRTRAVDNIKLGFFVLAGLFFLVFLLYMIGRNESLFRPTFSVRARFNNVQGLVAGNNVRYAGIQVGTVTGITILNDTLIEVRMIINTEMKPFIRRNAVASIGTDGLVGNRVINITPGREAAPLITEGDFITGRKALDTDEMLRVLSNTNNDVSVIARHLKETIEQVNKSTGLWRALNDETLPVHLKHSGENLQLATERAAAMAKDLQTLVRDIKQGKGSIGTLLTDTALAVNLNQAIQSIQMVGMHAKELTESIDSAVSDVHKEINNGKGTINTLLNDSTLVMKLHSSMNNIEKGTELFYQNMEALRHNFLLKGYFKKMEKQAEQQRKEAGGTE